MLPHAMDTFDPAVGLRPIDTTLSTRAYLDAMWRRRDFAVAMPAESLRSKHQNTLLGNLWHLANPMLTVGVYMIVFGGLLGVDRGIDNYLLWLTVGVFTYQLTSASVLGGATAISANQGLMRTLRFPRALLPISVVIGELLAFAFNLAAIGVVAVLTGAGVSQRWLLLPLVLTVHTMLNLGGAFVAARLNDSFRDIQQIIPFVFRLLQFLSGVMYPIERYLDSDHAWLHRLIVWNPIVRILELYRWVFLGTPVDLGALVQCVAVSAVVLIVGFRFFIRVEHQYGGP